MLHEVLEPRVRAGGVVGGIRHREDCLVGAFAETPPGSGSRDPLASRPTDFRKCSSPCIVAGERHSKAFDGTCEASLELWINSFIAFNPYSAASPGALEAGIALQLLRAEVHNEKVLPNVGGWLEADDVVRSYNCSSMFGSARRIPNLAIVAREPLVRPSVLRQLRMELGEG